MAFKKTTNSKGDGIFILNKSDKNRYPVGFEYIVGQTIFTVKEDVTKDAGSEMRRVVTSDGSVEIMTLESIDLDLREADSKVLNDGQPKEEQVTPETAEEVTEEKPLTTDKIEDKDKTEDEEKQEYGQYDKYEW